MSAKRSGNLLFLEVNTYMPDILASCDAIICGVGYSTLAEVYYAGIPCGYITRQHFQESQTLEEYIQFERQGMDVT